MDLLIECFENYLIDRQGDEYRKKILAYPMLKWAGGKRQLLPEIKKFFPLNYNRYFEPFVGAGAVFFEMQPRISCISDINEELINLYLVVKNNPQELIKELYKHQNSKEYFLQIRALDRAIEYKNMSCVQKAARMIYLNRTCFNGLYRVNSKGEFNVPFGNYSNPCIVNEENILNCSKILQITQIKCCDFSFVLDEAQEGDFVYFDPPYMPLNQTAAFTSYTKGGFGIEMHFRLKEVCDELNKKSIKFLLSNSDTQVVNKLYSSYSITKVFASRQISANPSKRGKITEVLIKNY